MEFIEGIEATPIHLKRKKVILIYTDEPIAMKALAARMRATGDEVRIINSSCFDDGGNDVEPAHMMVFINASKRDLIIQCARSDGFRELFPGVRPQFIDMDADGEILNRERARESLQESDTLLSLSGMVPKSSVLDVAGGPSMTVMDLNEKVPPPPEPDPIKPAAATLDPVVPAATPEDPVTPPADAAAEGEGKEEGPGDPVADAAALLGAPAKAKK